MGLVGEHHSYTYSNCRLCSLLRLEHRWIASECRRNPSPNLSGIVLRVRGGDLRLHFVSDDSVFLARHPGGLPEQGDAAHQLT